MLVGYEYFGEQRWIGVDEYATALLPLDRAGDQRRKGLYGTTLLIITTFFHIRSDDSCSWS